MIPRVYPIFNILFLALVALAPGSAGADDRADAGTGEVAPAALACSTNTEMRNCRIRRENCDAEFARLKLEVPEEYRIKCDQSELCATPVSATEDLVKGCGYAAKDVLEGAAALAKGAFSFVVSPFTETDAQRRERRLQMEDHTRREIEELRRRLAPYQDRIRAKCGAEPPDAELPNNLELLPHEEQVKAVFAHNRARIDRMPYLRCQMGVLSGLGVDPWAGRNEQAMAELRRAILKELEAAKVKLQCYNPVGQMKMICGVLGAAAAKPAAAAARTELKKLTGVDLKPGTVTPTTAASRTAPKTGEIISWGDGRQKYTARVIEAKPDGGLVLQDAGGFRRTLSADEARKLALEPAPSETVAAFTRLEKTGQLPDDPRTQVVRSVEIEVPAPTHHVGNIAERASPVGSRYDLYREQLKPGSKIMLVGNDAKGKLVGDLEQRSMITQVSPDGRFIEATAPDGSRIYLKVTSENQGRLQTVQIRPDEAPFDLRRRAYTDGDMIAKVRAGFNPRTLSDEEYARQLTLGQMSASSTVTRGPSVAAANLQEMNRKVVERIRSNQPLTVDDLSQWNRLANKDAIAKELADTPGVVRGTRARVLDPNAGSVKVDLSRTELGAAASDGFTFSVRYLPAQEVPRRLNGLVGRVNQLGPRNSLRDVATIYQDYIKIHPFVDGNGRTARALVDYSLARIGLPPIPAGKSLPREALFQSPDELAATIRALYGH